MVSENVETNWFTFEIRVSAVLDYLERKTGSAYDPGLTSAAGANSWHIAFREGIFSPLHLNLGIPGIEHPEHPIEENESALFAALLLGRPTLPVILSGEWQLAVSEGLITPGQLRAHERAGPLIYEL